MAYHGPLDTSSADNNNREDRELPYEPIEDRLKRLSSYFPTLINTHDFALQREDVQELVACISLDWTASMDTQPQQVPWSEQLMLWKARSGELPNVRFEIKHVEVDLNNKKGSATVWVEMDVTGMGDVVFGAMNEVKWRRVKDQWECFHTRGMRGSPSSSTGGIG
ncbi:hypothetical protein Slin15195_G121470 [Septoria linicola]|uniref:Uncharacterized protein n=1 Tax=Septoria linicola TaxID=215465 RepID=A0A9Q9B7H7_9PEZI|nr:hypothetical protein Slin15195_G121470 [Septoria linicola]